MSLGTAARFARRELRGGLRGFRVFLGCVILGIAAIAGIGTIRESIATGLAQEGARLLGGDAEIELTYRFASAGEQAWMSANAETVSEIVDFRSMAVTPQGARGLTQVKAVDSAYPLIGTLSLDPEMPVGQALNPVGPLPGAVIHPLLADRLDLSPGDTFRLGRQDFRLTALIQDEPDNATAGFGLGPRTIVATRALDRSGLLGPGTLFSTRYRLDLPLDADLARLQRDAESALPASGMRWRDARNGAPGVAEFVDRMGAFLVLVGLSGLAVGGVGISAALRGFLAGKTQTIATLRTLGANWRTVFLTYAIQIGVLAICGIALGLLLGVGVPVLLAPTLEARLPVPAVFAPYPGPMAEAAIYSVLAVTVFSLWPLARTQEMRAAALYRDTPSLSGNLPAWRFLAATAVLLALLLFAAAWFSGDPRLTLWTAGGIAGALVLLALAAQAIRLAARWARGRVRGRPAFGWALGAIGGPGSTAGSVVVSLGLGLSVLAAVGQIDSNLRGAIENDLPAQAPSYFFVDIQKDQIDTFLTRMKQDQGVSQTDHAPMLRGIITQINGLPAAEVAGDHWVLEGDRGITYATEPPRRTRLTRGNWWPPDHAGPPQVSFAAEEAAEMGLDIGDSITVNILGRDITATITSLREVDFSTAGMGFVMAMNPAALAGAPHTFIATVYADPGAESAILRDVTDRFPNVTAIRVRDVVDRVSTLLSGLASATAWGASAALLTGFLVLVGAAAADQRGRIYEAAILKTIGATRGRILFSLALRALILGAAAGVVALGAGIAGGWAVCRFVMETDFAADWASALQIVGGGALVSLLAGLGFAAAPMAARPAKLLRARE